MLGGKVFGNGSIAGVYTSATAPHLAAFILPFNSSILCSSRPSRLLFANLLDSTPSWTLDYGRTKCSAIRWWCQVVLRRALLRAHPRRDLDHLGGGRSVAAHAGVGLAGQHHWQSSVVRDPVHSQDIVVVSMVCTIFIRLQRVSLNT